MVEVAGKFLQESILLHFWGLNWNQFELDMVEVLLPDNLFQALILLLLIWGPMVLQKSLSKDMVGAIRKIHLKLIPMLGFRSYVLYTFYTFWKRLFIKIYYLEPFLHQFWGQALNHFDLELDMLALVGMSS